MTPLVEAMLAGDAGRSRAILDDSSRTLAELLPDGDPWTWLEEASSEAIVSLMELRPDEMLRPTDRPGPLLAACDLGLTRVVGSMVQGGADLEVRNPWTGWTALIAATIAGAPGAVGLLIDGGARMDAADDAGDTALHHAGRSEDGAVAVALTAQLLERGADPNMRNLQTWTPLIEAAAVGAAGVVAVLLGDDQCDANLVDSTRRSALHHAAETGDLAIVQQLINAGANPVLTDVDGSTARTLATLNAADGIVAFLWHAESGEWVDEPSGDMPRHPAVESSPQTMPVAHLAGEVYAEVDEQDEEDVADG